MLAPSFSRAIGIHFGLIARKNTEYNATKQEKKVDMKKKKQKCEVLLDKKKNTKT